MTIASLYHRAALILGQSNLGLHVVESSSGCQEELNLVYARLRALAVKSEHDTDYLQLLNLIPSDHDEHRNAVLLREWGERSLPVGSGRMNSDLGTSSTTMHNRDAWDSMDPTKLYLLYDHYRTAFWGGKRRGYSLRRINAGLYSKEEAAEVVLSSNRYFTVEEVPAQLVAILLSRPEPTFI